MKRLGIVLGAVLAVGAALVWNGRTPEEPSDRPADAPPAAGSGWARLDPQARCDSALVLVTHSARWPTVCRWRNPGEVLQGQAFPPPPGAPPYDDPHVELYIAPTQGREEVARAIAHEYGHMHHTREPAFAAEWLAARGLPGSTPSEVWTEDYAEVFADLFGPPGGRWRAPTTRPAPDALAALKSRFFSG